MCTCCRVLCCCEKQRTVDGLISHPECYNSENQLYNLCDQRGNIEGMVEASGIKIHVFLFEVLRVMNRKIMVFCTMEMSGKLHGVICRRTLIFKAMCRSSKHVLKLTKIWQRK